VARESGAPPFELVGCRQQCRQVIQDRWWVHRESAGP